MENSYSQSLSRKNKVSSVSPAADKNTYQYARVKLPLLSKNNLKKIKSTSDYSTGPAKRAKQGYYEKSILKNNSKAKEETLSRHMVTDR